MKTEFVDLSETRKDLIVEIPTDTVEAEIDRVTRDYSRSARLPGFRPGKVPPSLVRKRFRDRILHDVAHGLVPRAVGDALRERGVEPVDTPDIRDLTLEEGQPLRFTASFETVPPIDPGDYTSLTLRRPPVALEEDDVTQALERLRQHAARYTPVEDRPAELGDTLAADVERWPDEAAASDKTERHENVSIELGAETNPPGFDAELVGLTAGATKTFAVTYPEDYAIDELAGTRAHFTVAVSAIRRRVIPELDDELAKDLGDFASLEALTERVREDLRTEAEAEANRQVRIDLAKQLAERVSFDVPEALIGREVDRRVEDFVRRLLDQEIDPTKAKIDWEEVRAHHRETALETVRASLVVDEVARREGLDPSQEEIQRQLDRYAERSGHTAAAVRARMEQEGALVRLESGLRREKTFDFLLARATIIKT